MPKYSFINKNGIIRQITGDQAAIVNMVDGSIEVITDKALSIDELKAIERGADIKVIEL